MTPGRGTALKNGLARAVAAEGLWSDLADSVVGGFDLAVKADALSVGKGIEGVEGLEGSLAATQAAGTRFRTGLEASRSYSFKSRQSLQPSLEVGLRRDGGDAERGAGVDIGGGLLVSDTLIGLSADVRVRTPLGFLANVTPS